MAEAETMAAALVSFRKKRDRLFRTYNKIHGEFMNLRHSDGFERISLAIVKDKAAAVLTMHKRILKQIEALDEDEEDEEMMQADEVARQNHSEMHDQATNVAAELYAIKKLSALLLAMESEMAGVEREMTSDPEKDYSKCFFPIDRLADKITSEITEGCLDGDHELVVRASRLTGRIVKMKAAQPEVKPATASAKSSSKNIDTIKVTMPKFEGDIASWPAFWHRYLPAVHNNVKLTADAKMAVLTDLVVDPGLSKYLVATNDGKPGRYDEAIRILLERYDRPKQLHHKYIMDLFNLNSFNDDATAIAEAADTVATAVTGLLRSDQATIEHIATSIVTPCMPERMRAEWDARTVDDVGVPSIHKWVDFLRKRVANAPTKASDTVTVKESSTHNNSRQRKQPTKYTTITVNLHPRATITSSRRLGMLSHSAHYVMLVIMFSSVSSS